MRATDVQHELEKALAECNYYQSDSSAIRLVARRLGLTLRPKVVSKFYHEIVKAKSAA